jgi:mannose-6-phosphate isomerase-like protein (cupin superfamily)
MEELLRELDSRPALIEHLKSQELPILISEDGLCELRVTGALETVEWLQCYELKAELGGTLSSSPHPDGSIESLYVRSGQAELTVDGQSFLVGAGELARYRGDVPHCIIAQGDEPLFATMTVSRR